MKHYRLTKELLIPDDSPIFIRRILGKSTQHFWRLRKSPVLIHDPGPNISLNIDAKNR